jgi:molybdenum cofactor cytidylyltransferase
MQSFAVIPAAGRSERMGQPKLLLPWGTSTMIEHVLGVWRDSRVDRVVVVVHPLDAQLAEVCAACGAQVVQPAIPPGEMKVSIRVALEFLARFEPRPADAWLLAPADIPGLRVNTINALLAAYEADRGDAAKRPRIWAPRRGTRHGHPVLFPWSLAAQVGELAPDEGVNVLLSRSSVEFVDVAEDSILEDVDTPEDYERLRSRLGG